MMHFVAEFASENSMLIQYGGLGCVLVWFMVRGERVFSKLSDLSHRIDGLTKALLVDMIEKDHTSISVKKYAKETIARIDARAATSDK